MKRKIVRGLESHLIKSIAQIIPTAPFLTLADMYWSGNTPEQSLKARAASVGITLVGATIYDKVREFLLKYTGAEQGKNPTALTAAQDAVFNALAFAAGGVVSYSIAGVNSLPLLANNIATASMVGLVSGPLVGMTTDVLKDWYHIEPCPRLHPEVRNRTQRQKKLLTGLAAAISIGATTTFAYTGYEYKVGPRETYHQNP